MRRPSIADVCSYSVSNLSGSSPGFPGPQVSPVSGQEDKQCRYPAGNNNMADPVMNYAASLATASSPGTNIAAAAHFYQQQVNYVDNTRSLSLPFNTITADLCLLSL